MNRLVEDARDRAEESREGAVKSLASAESAKQTAESLQVMREQLERIADATEPRRELTIREVSKNNFALINSRLTGLRCEHVRNREQFVRIDLDDKFTVAPGGQKKFLAVEAWGAPIPDNLVIDEIGLDEPTVIPIDRLA